MSSEPADQIINILFSERDMAEIAVEDGIDPDAAIARLRAADTLVGGAVDEAIGVLVRRLTPIMRGQA